MNELQIVARAYQQYRRSLERDDAVSRPLLQLQPGEPLDVERLRDDHETFYLNFIWTANGVAALTHADHHGRHLSWVPDYRVLRCLIGGTAWLSWELTYATIYGDSIEVGPKQFPQIYNVVKEA